MIRALRSVAARIGRRHLLLFAIATAVYTPAFWWGTPHATAADRANAWGVDDEPPMGPLAQLHDIVNPKPVQNPNLGYPMLHPFMVLGAYGPYMVWLKATGGLGTPTEAFPHGFTDPVAALRNLTLIAHFLSVLLAALTVVAAYETGRTLWDEASGLWGAAFAGLAFPMFYYARTSNVDVPVLCFTALAGAAFAHCVQRGTTLRRATVLGVLIGAALATKEPAFASFLGIPVALLLLPVTPGGPAAWRVPSTWRAAAACLAATVLAYAVGSGMIVDPDRWLAHIAFIRERSGDAVKGAVAFMPHYPRTWEGHVALAGKLARYLADALTWPGLALGVLGIGLSLRRAPRSAWYAATVVTYLVVLFWSARAAQLRYIMPPAFGLALFAGYAARCAWHARGTLLRVTGVGLAAASLGLAALRGVDLTAAMLADSRHDAAQWLRLNARPGDRLEYFGSDQKHPPMEAWLASGRAIPYLGGNVPARRDAEAAREVLQGWNDRAPRFVMLIPDFTSFPGEPFAASCPPEVFARLEAGDAGYRRVAHFEGHTLFPWVRRPALDYPVVSPPILLYERVVPRG